MKGGGVFCLTFTERGRALARRFCGALGAELSCTRDGASLRGWTAERFPKARALVFVGAAGIAVRAVAPCVASKDGDPAVVAVDEGGRFAVSLLSGHLGGANALARRIAELTGATPVVTTATDLYGAFAADEWARVQGCAVADPAKIKAVSLRALDGETVRVRSAFPIAGEPPEGVALTDSDAPDLWVDVRPHPELTVVPPALVLGVGCKRGVTEETLERRFAELCRARGFLPQAVRAAATIDRKGAEPGLLGFCAARGWPLLTYPSRALAALAGEFSASAFVTETVGVDNVCERAAVLAAGGGLVVRKYAGEGVTLALALGEVKLDWRSRDG